MYYIGEHMVQSAQMPSTSREFAFCVNHSWIYYHINWSHFTRIVSLLLMTLKVRKRNMSATSCKKELYNMLVQLKLLLPVQYCILGCARTV